MLIISLLTHIQHCVMRYKTRKALSRLTTQQMLDIGVTKDRQQAESRQASIYGFSQDLINRLKKGV